MTLMFTEIREGSTYEMTSGDGLGGKFYVAGDPVVVLFKEAGHPFQCRNLRTGVPFFTAGASSFRAAAPESATCRCGMWPISEYGETCPSCPPSSVGL